ncbi:ATPase involved in DNA repair [Caballeronia glathei]|jgi:hypothetical protein|uniref:Transcriptional regulator n=1 Tax=Caballeronia glathei TaxID=60547 RepID=A0A069PSX5_9BURK|nr:MULTISPECIES: hypothetical protein [Burkholderiaceae]KDR43522.1 hypothetical protein BG61_35910 [Caballeronia glathei]TCK39131.1 hypothetical protein B0G84_4461 [Paraburkholderia sp. BL8N3]CDY75234.1 ATPase involved in DNA repair [Caballeronia glathei]
MHNPYIHNYNGYKVVPSAHRLPDGSFASNLLLERHGGADRAMRYQFHALDYFDDEHDALGHSCQWAREWVDCRG